MQPADGHEKSCQPSLPIQTSLKFHKFMSDANFLLKIFVIYAKKL